MPKKIHLSILESEQDLRLLLTKNTTDRVRGRIKALLLLKQGKVEYQSHLANKLGFTEKTIREWLKLYQSKDQIALDHSTLSRFRTILIPLLN